MTREYKVSTIEESRVIGYWSCLGGVEVRKIDYTPDGIMFWIKANAWCSKPTYHRTKVIEQYTSDGAHRDHVKIYNQRLYLDDCLREFGR